jgi:hypothetical protein
VLDLSTLAPRVIRSEYQSDMTTADFLSRSVNRPVRVRFDLPVADRYVCVSHGQYGRYATMCHISCLITSGGHEREHSQGSVSSKQPRGSDEWAQQDALFQGLGRGMVKRRSLVLLRGIDG